MRDRDSEDNNTSNPFIRFRHHVDANIHAGINTLTSLSRSPPSPPPQQHPPSPSIPSTLHQPIIRDTASTSSSKDMTSTSTDTDITKGMLLSPADQHLESRLDLLRHGGATAPESALAWRLFVTRSAYSPLRLQQEWGWQQPRPAFAAGAGEEGGGGDYYGGGGGGAGWLDAFEDLMRASSGLEMLDLRAREERGEEEDGFGFGGLGGLGGLPYHHHHHIHGMVGFSFPGMQEMAWLERMWRQGLTEVLFPVYDPGLGYVSPRTMGEWAERRRAEDRRTKEVGRVWEELVGEGRRAVEEARRKAEREVDAWQDAAQQKGLSFLDGVGDVVRTLAGVLEDIGSMPRAGSEEKRRGKDDTAREKREGAPETENDLYSVVQSAFQESERSLSKFFRSFSEAWRIDTLPEPKPASPPKTEITEVAENGITKKTTKREFVDKDGNTHSKIETTWTDQDGRIVMRQVHSSMGRSEHWEKAENRTPRQDKVTAEELKEHRKEGGWFWK